MSSLVCRAGKHISDEEKTSAIILFIIIIIFLRIFVGIIQIKVVDHLAEPLPIILITEEFEGLTRNVNPRWLDNNAPCENVGGRGGVEDYTPK